MSLLELRGVSMAFGGLRVISDLDLGVREGEIVSVIGPNGAGKTTALQPDHGDLPPRRGRDPASTARALSGLPPHAITNRGIARTFQTLRLFLNMTVKENVMAAAYGQTHATAHRVDPAHARDARARSARSSALAEERLGFFGERLMGYRWNQTCVQPLVRQPPASGDRTGDGDEAADPPPRRTGRRDESHRDARDHRADQPAAERGRLHDPRDRARHALRRGMLRPGRRARPRREDRGRNIREVATDPKVVEAYLGLRAGRSESELERSRGRAAAPPRGDQHVLRADPHPPGR